MLWWYLLPFLGLMASTCRAEETAVEETPAEEISLTRRGEVPSFLQLACRQACAMFCRVSHFACINVPPYIQCNLMEDSCDTVCSTTCDCLVTCGPQCEKVYGDCSKKPPLQVSLCTFQKFMCGMYCRMQCPMRGLLANMGNLFKYILGLVPLVIPGGPQLVSMINLHRLLTNPVGTLFG